MSKITRCPHCISLVYRGDANCHHCGEALDTARPRILTRNRVVFILVAVTVFGIADAVYLSKERGKQHRYDESWMRRFIDRELVRDSRDMDLIRAWRGTEGDLDRIKGDFRQLVGTTIKTRHGRADFLGSYPVAHHPDRSLRGWDSRRYTYHLEWKQRGGDEYHHLPIGFALAGSIHNIKVLAIDWDGRSPGSDGNGG